MLAKSRLSLKTKLPAVIVERARPYLINPDFDVEGYRYGRVQAPPRASVPPLGEPMLSYTSVQLLTGLPHRSFSS